jgi:hypothetical protein
LASIFRKRFGIMLPVGLAILLLPGLASRSKMLRENVSRRDSIAYWAAGRLLLMRQNPYQASAVLELEQAQGYRESKPLVLRTPPWSLFMTLGPGLASAFWAWVMWILFSISALILSTRLCWRAYHVLDKERRSQLVLVSYAFAPVPACLVSGQMGLLLLLGIVLFLYLESEHSLLAGAALLLPLAKPHLLASFWLILAIYVVIHRKLKLAAGLGSAMLASSAVALALNTAIFQDYRLMLREAAIQHEFIPALSGVIRGLFFHNRFWVQFLPCIAGMIWSVRFFVRQREHWSWRQHGPALLVVSVLTTPYSWMSDEAVLIPAMIQAAIWMLAGQVSLGTRFVIVVIAALDGLLLMILSFKIPFATGIYFWSSLVWAGWYWYGYRKKDRSLMEMQLAR